ncbi:hypothetical protein J4558_27745 [Leptolyngbya sp. 15MV]|nr:hypothetical protein J4558_27745 [Leptolyngbya sp. 15MV]
MTTQGRTATDPGFAVSDHVHAEDWGMLGPAASPALAAAQMEIAAHGGPPRSTGARANYGFLDGHAATLTFGDVYRGPYENKFFPDFAR